MTIIEFAVYIVILKCDQVSLNFDQNYWTYRQDTSKNDVISWTKDNNSWWHGAIWSIIELEHIMVLKYMTKFYKILIKTI